MSCSLVPLTCCHQPCACAGYHLHVEGAPQELRILTMKLKIAGEWKQPFNIRKKKWPYVPTKLKVLVRPPTSSEPPCFWPLLLNLFHLLELGDLFLYGSRTSSVGATGTHVGIGVGVGGDGLKYGAVCDIKGIGPGSGIFGNSSKGRPTWKLAFKTRVSVKSTVKNS